MRSSPDLHGSAPDDSPVAVLVIDMINGFAFPGGDALLRSAVRIAPRIRALTASARKAHVPVIYVNDNFGRWRSDFRAVVRHCLRPQMPGRRVVEQLRPQHSDYFVLKPKHSGFYSTTLSLLLEHLSTRQVVLTGVAANLCVLFTAQDAYVRGLSIVVPSDCVASETMGDTRLALTQMRRSLRAATTPSTRLELRSLAAHRAA